MTESQDDPAEAVARFLLCVQSLAVDETAIAALTDRICRPQDRERVNMAAALAPAVDLRLTSGLVEAG